MPRLLRLRHPSYTARRIAAGLLAVMALVLALRPPPRPATASGPAPVPVVVAAGDLAAGTTLTAHDLALARLPVAAVPRGAARDPTPLLGRALAGSVRAGEPLTDVRLVGTRLTELLPAGQVAAPIRLSDLAVAALVHTGDRVDVLATAGDGHRAEVEAAGALVLAVGAPADPGTGAAGGLLLIAVDPATAARLAAAATTATLTVTLPHP
jgi:pilus assembly protein CpaB